MCQLKMISQSRLCAVHTEYNVFILLRPGNVNIAQLQLLDRFASPAPISNAFGIFTFVIVSMLRCIYSQAKTGSARRAENVRITDMTTRFFCVSRILCFPRLPSSCCLSVCSFMEAPPSLPRFLSGFTAHPVSAAHTGRFSQDTGLLNHSKPRP